MACLSFKLTVLMPNPFTGTSRIVKHWFSVFFLDKRYSCCGMN